MELLAVPQTVAPRAVTPSRGTDKRNDDNNAFPKPERTARSARLDASKNAQRSQIAESDDNRKGLAGLTALAKRIKLAPASNERSLHKQLEARTRMMRNRLSQAYQPQVDDNSVNQSQDSGMKMRAQHEMQRQQAMPDTEQSQGNMSHPIHLVV